MPFIPLTNRVALRRITDDPAASPGLSMFSIPDSAREKPLECEVVAVPAGPWITEFGAVLHCPVRVGQRVLVGKYTAGEHRTRREDGTEEELLYLRWEELLAAEVPTSAARVTAPAPASTSTPAAPPAPASPLKPDHNR